MTNNVPFEVFTIQFVISFIIVLITTPIVMKIMKKRKIIGIDVHKLSRPEVPEMGGIAVFIGIFVSVLVYFIPNMSSLTEGYDLIKDSTFDIRVVVFLISVTIAFLIGIYDDLKPFNAAAKPVLLILASIPILVMDAYSPTPVLPIIGPTRLTYFYVILVLLNSKPLAVVVLETTLKLKPVGVPLLS